MDRVLSRRQPVSFPKMGRQHRCVRPTVVPSKGAYAARSAARDRILSTGGRGVLTLAVGEVSREKGWT
jgi:hypothetical protein